MAKDAKGYSRVKVLNRIPKKVVEKQGYHIPLYPQDFRRGSLVLTRDNRIVKFSRWTNRPAGEFKYNSLYDPHTGIWDTEAKGRTFYYLTDGSDNPYHYQTLGNGRLVRHSVRVDPTIAVGGASRDRLSTRYGERMIKDQLINPETESLNLREVFAAQNRAANGVVRTINERGTILNQSNPAPKAPKPPKPPEIVR